MIISAPLAFALAGLALCSEPSKTGPKGPPQKIGQDGKPDTGVLMIKKDQPGKDKIVRLKTSDGWWIVLAYRAPRKAMPVAVFVHGYGAGRSEWSGLAADLHKRGWGSLALDLRGHGDSHTGPAGRVDFNYIDAKGDWNDSVRDIDLALGFLRERKVPADRVCLMGASLGANLAALAAAKTPGLACVVLLSPGRDYRGVLLDEARAPSARTLAAASSSDPYAFQTLTGLRARGARHTLLEAGRGHGVAMFQDLDFYGEFLAWLDRSVEQVGKSPAHQ